MRSMHSLLPSLCPTRPGNPGSDPPPVSPLVCSPEEPDPAQNTPLSPGPDSNENSFSVSLSDLRQCTIERGEEGGDLVSRPSPSACAHSVISAIPPQEIQTMIQEVKALDEETLKVKLCQSFCPCVQPVCFIVFHLFGGPSTSSSQEGPH
nr:pro-interleukin-16-like [Oncorhynchus nerka]